MRSLIILGLAQAALGIKNLTSSGCVDASGFQSCQDAANAKIQACFTKAGASSELQQGCSCEDYILNYNCYSAHCWNQVWGCDYQEYMVAYLTSCPTAKLPVPYFPIPDNVKTGCSCNVGKIYNAITSLINQGASCEKAQTSNPDAFLGAEKMGACQCCELSGAMSSIYETCPDTNPDLVGTSQISKIAAVMGLSFSQCEPMTKINCASDLSFSVAGVSTYYPPSGLPAKGTATLSDKPGQVTAPASGSVFTYTNGGDNYPYTITAASAKGGSGSNGGSGGSDSGSNGGSGSGGSGGGSGSGTAAASASATGKSDAKSLRLNWGLLVLVLAVGNQAL